MKRPREKMRRLLLQQLERRCVMDASGFDELMETTQVADLDATPMMYTMDASDVDFAGTSAVGDLTSDTADFDPAHVMYFSMARGASSDEQDADGLIAVSSFSEDGSVDISELERTTEDVTIQTFGATSTEYSIESDEEAIEFILDIDQNGLVSSVDVWMIINSLNSPDALASGAEYDVNGDSLVSPLDVLIVINELNSAQAGVNGFAAPVVSSSRLATRINPEWMTNSDDSTSDDSTASNSLIAADDMSADESVDESLRLVDSVLAEFDDTSDDASFVGRIMPIETYKKDSSIEEESNEDLSSDALSDSEADGIKEDESLPA